MSEQIEPMPSVDKLAAALAKAQGEFPAVQKTGRNPHLRNEYATLDDIIGAIRAPLAKHGLSFVQLLGTNGLGVATLRTVLLHESGQRLESTVSIEVGDQKGINALQALGASITYMKRYSLAAMLGIAADVDTDGEGTTQPKAKAEQPEKNGDAPKPEPGHGRPLAADALREVVRKKAGWQDGKRIDGEPVTEKQIPYVATLMSELFPNLPSDLGDKYRHDVLMYLVGVDSTKKLTKAEATALIDWMKDAASATVEAARILEATAIAAGQQELPL